MTDTPLDNLEFSSKSESRTPAEFIDTIHDPDVLYHYINDAYKKAQQDLTVDADDKTSDVTTHAKVEVFQSAMQYAETFGIYLLAYIKGRENLIDHVIKTSPGDVESFFDHLQNDRIDDWLADNNIDDDFQTVLETIFGYLYVDSVEHPEEGELTGEDLNKRISESTSILSDELNTVGEFYTMFRDIYNAVKHGNRALPQSEGNFQFTPSNTDEDTVSVDLDMKFVMFVCRNNSGDPYITTLPVDYLLEHTLMLTEKIHNLFTHLKTVSHAVITEEPFDISFFTYTETTEDEDNEDGDEDKAVSDWVMAQHPSGIVIFPRTEEIAALESEPHEWTFAARLELDNNSLILRTRNNDTTTDDYPISVTTRQKGIVGLTPQPIIGLNINFTLEEIDAIQYYELLQIQDLAEAGSLNDIVIIDEQADKEFPAGTFNDFPLSEIEEFIDRNHIEQVALLQEITQRHIPAPLTVFDDQIDVIERAIEADLTRDDAIELIETLDRLGDGHEHTLITVEKQQPDGSVIDSKRIDAPPGTVGFEATTTDGETYDDEIEHVRIPTTITHTTYDEMVAWIRDDPNALDELVAQIPDDFQTPSVAPRVYIEYQRPEESFWFRKHELTIEVLSEEFGLHPPMQCELCGETTRDMHQHILADCPVLNRNT
jgi:hypothetical protein